MQRFLICLLNFLYPDFDQAAMNGGIAQAKV